MSLCFRGRPETLLWSRHDNGPARFLTRPPIGMRKRRVKVHRVTRRECVRFCSDVQFQLAAQHRYEFDSRMLMRPGFAALKGLTLSIVGVDFSFHGGEVQRFKIKRNVASVSPLGKPLALSPAHDCHYMTFFIVGKEILQTNTEHQGNS